MRLTLGAAPPRLPTFAAWTDGSPSTYLHCGGQRARRRMRGKGTLGPRRGGVRTVSGRCGGARHSPLAPCSPWPAPAAPASGATRARAALRPAPSRSRRRRGSRRAGAHGARHSSWRATTWRASRTSTVGRAAPWRPNQVVCDGSRRETRSPLRRSRAQTEIGPSRPSRGGDADRGVGVRRPRRRPASARRRGEARIVGHGRRPRRDEPDRLRRCCRGAACRARASAGPGTAPSTITSRPAAAAWPAERRPQRGLDDLVPRRALEHEQRAEPRGRGRSTTRRQRVVELRPRRRPRSSARPARPARRNTPRRRCAPAARRGEDHGVAGQQRGGGLERRLGPRRRGRPAQADHADRRLHEPRAAAGEPRRARRRRRSASARGPSSASARRPRAAGSSSESTRCARGQPVSSASTQREVVELVEHRHRRAPDVARPRGDGHQRPQRLRGQLRRHGAGPPGSGRAARAAPARCRRGRRSAGPRRPRQVLLVVDLPGWSCG